MTARSPNELAVRAGVPAAFVERLVDLGIVAAADDGTFSDADVYKVRFVRSSDLGGLSIEAIARAIRERRFSLAFMEGSHYRWAALSSRTYAEVAEETGFPVDLVLSFEEALGKVRPEPDDPAPEDLISMLEVPRVALEAGVDWRTHARALRVYAESLGRIAENGGRRVPPLHRAAAPRVRQGEMIGAVNLIGVELAPAMEKLVLAVYPASKSGCGRTMGCSTWKARSRRWACMNGPSVRRRSRSSTSRATRGSPRNEATRQRRDSRQTWAGSYRRRSGNATGGR